MSTTGQSHRNGAIVALHITMLLWCVLLVSPLQAQQKKVLSEQDYALWNKLSVGEVSRDGLWMSYAKSYLPLDSDTLFVTNTKTGRSHAYPGAYNGKFSKDGKWFGYMADGKVSLCRVGNWDPSISRQANDFYMVGGYLVTIAPGHPASMHICDMQGRALKSIGNVKEFAIAPTQPKIALTCAQDKSAKASLLLLESTITQYPLLCSGQSLFNGLKWSQQGEALAFYESGNAGAEKLHHFTFGGQRPQHSVVQPQDHPVFKGWAMAESGLLFSGDGQRVFFDRKPVANKQKEKVNVQVWTTTDLRVPPESSRDSGRYLTAWNVEEGTMMPIEDSLYGNAVIAGSGGCALLLDKSPYLPQFRHVGAYADVYLKDLSSGENSKVICRQLYQDRQLCLSPTAKYIAYYKEHHWWAYAVGTGQIKCLTCGLPDTFYKDDYDYAGEQPPFGIGAWSKDDRHVAIYGKYDIWKVDPQTGKAQQLTHGAKDNLSFRFKDQELVPGLRSSFVGFTSRTMDMDGSLFMEASSIATGKERIYYYSDGKEIELIEKNSDLQILFAAGNNGLAIVREAGFETPPRFLAVRNGKQEKLIAQSNTQQKKFYWGKLQLRTYKAFDGSMQKNALYYPANYDPSKKYPMIVSIYDKQTKKMHQYWEPAMENTDGFNIANYTSQGYFVMAPDIIFKLDEPGDSALSCVTAAVNEVLATGIIDEKRIGLIGHSFGGYEVAYIISHADIFKAAVAGAPVTDLLSYYLTLDGAKLSNIWRFENQQFRIQAPFYSKEFLDNSPILRIDKINTPLLLWTGTNDSQVDWSNSLKLQVGLWRLQKPSILLVYPEEQHVLTNKENQSDLTIRLKNWFEQYLKS